MLDLFRSDAYGVVSLTKAINLLPYTPMRLGELGIFKEEGITTQTVVIEYAKGLIQLVQTTPWGAPAQTAAQTTRFTKAFAVPHLQQLTSVLAGEIQGVRAFGSEDSLETLNNKVNAKLQQLKQNIEATKEWHRVGAIHGQLRDADGTVLTNFFTEFGITEKSVNFALTTSGTDVKAKCLEVARYMKGKCEGVPGIKIRAFCGDNFFDALTGHPAVVESWKRWQDGAFLRTQQNEQGFEFGGIFWENYYGSVGSTPYVNTDKCRFIPDNGPSDLFGCANAPADWIETVNTTGKPFYSKQNVLKWDTGVEILAQANPFHYCTRPSVLVEGVKA